MFYALNLLGSPSVSEEGLKVLSETHEIYVLLSNSHFILLQVRLWLLWLLQGFIRCGWDGWVEVSIVNEKISWLNDSSRNSLAHCSGDSSREKSCKSVSGADPWVDNLQTLTPSSDAETCQKTKFKIWWEEDSWRRRTKSGATWKSNPHEWRVNFAETLFCSEATSSERRTFSLA